MYQKHSCIQQVKTGFLMGMAVGAGIGVIFGTLGAVRMRLKGRDLIYGLGKTIAQTGFTFGFFMSIGQAIRGCTF